MRGLVKFSAGAKQMRGRALHGDARASWLYHARLPGRLVIRASTMRESSRRRVARESAFSEKMQLPAAVPDELQSHHEGQSINETVK